MRIAELEMPAYHQRPSSPTNLTLHQALDLNVPIGCGDVAVFPGDILVGDDDCVIVIPVHLVEEIAEEAVEMTAFEDFVVERVTWFSLVPPPTGVLVFIVVPWLSIQTCEFSNCYATSTRYWYQYQVPV